MKAFLRSRPVQGLLAALTWAYLGLVLHTIRWRHINREGIDAEMAMGRGAMGCIWHGTIPLVIGGVPVLAGRPLRALISLSADGEFITRAIALHGIEAIRGSAAKKGKTDGKGGAAALRECLDWLANRGLLLVTPDGPRGPAHKVAIGIARMAKLSQAPVYMIGLAAHPVRELNSWDRTQLPAPFGKGAVVWHGPLRAPADATDDDLAALCVQWADELNGACDRAKAALA